MAKPFLSYYEHIAKLSQVANKQTIFLAHLLWDMNFDSEIKQYIVDMSAYKKIKIMKEISPEIDDKNLLKLANQYLNKLKKADLINTTSKRGVWAINPMCYGQRYMISKDMREENYKLYTKIAFDKDGMTSMESGIDNE